MWKEAISIRAGWLLYYRPTMAESLPGPRAPLPLKHSNIGGGVVRGARFLVVLSGKWTWEENFVSIRQETIMQAFCLHMGGSDALCKGTVAFAPG